MTEPNDNKPCGEVLGIDKQETFNHWLGAMQQHLDSPEAKRASAEEAAKASYETRDTIFMRVVKRTWGQRTWYEGTCIAGLPDQTMSIRLEMDNVEDLLSETKFLFAEALFKARVCGTFDAAKLRASKCQVELADLVT